MNQPRFFAKYIRANGVAHWAVYDRRRKEPIREYMKRAEAHALAAARNDAQSVLDARLDYATRPYSVEVAYQTGDHATVDRKETWDDAMASALGIAHTARTNPGTIATVHICHFNVYGTHVSERVYP